jgi:PAS domain S-box-containing protein
MNRSVLIVEDDPIIANLISIFLGRKGDNVAGTVETGEDAIYQAIETVPDIVLMDITLKGRMDGIDAALCISGFLHIPVIFLTAGTDDSTINRVKKIHPFGFVTKPFNERDIHSAIDIAMSNYQAMKKALDSSSINPKIVMHDNDAVVVTNCGGSVLFVNPTAEELLGKDRKNVATAPLDELIALRNEAANQPMTGLVQQAITENRDLKYSYAISLENRLGRKKYVSIEVKRLRNEFHEIYGALVIFRDGMPLASQ